MLACWTEISSASPPSVRTFGTLPTVVNLPKDHRSNIFLWSWELWGGGCATLKWIKSVCAEDQRFRANCQSSTNPQFEAVEIFSCRSGAILFLSVICHIRLSSVALSLGRLLLMQQSAEGRENKYRHAHIHVPCREVSPEPNQGSRTEAHCRNPRKVWNKPAGTHYWDDSGFMLH